MVQPVLAVVLAEPDADVTRVLRVLARRPDEHEDIDESRTPTGTPGTPDFPVMPEGANPAGLVFPQAHSFTNVLRETHRRRGTFLMSAHDLRHLAASRWLHEGVLSPAEIAARLGHSTVAITLGVYSHTVPPD